MKAHALVEVLHLLGHHIDEVAHANLCAAHQFSPALERPVKANAFPAAFGMHKPEELLRYQAIRILLGIGKPAQRAASSSLPSPLWRPLGASRRARAPEAAWRLQMSNTPVRLSPVCAAISS